MTDKINFSIDEGDNFFAHEVSINFNPTQFVFDFKCITPRVDPRSNEAKVISIKHNTVMLDTYHTKEFFRFLKERIADFEKEFGKIEKPSSIKTIEKKKKIKAKENKSKSKKLVKAPEYFG